MTKLWRFVEAGSVPPRKAGKAPDPDPEHLAEAIAKGAEYLERGVTDFAKWSRAMVYKFGEPVRPHLERIWTAAQGSMIESASSTPHHAPAGCNSASGSTSRSICFSSSYRAKRRS